MAFKFQFPQNFSAIAGGLGASALTLGFVGYSARNCLYNVEPGHRAIIFSRLSGISEQIQGEGTHLMMPWIHRPIFYNVRTRPRIIKSLTGSRDLQMVDISCRVLSRPNDLKLPSIYRTLGTDYEERVLPSIINEVVKSVVAQYNASQLITQREVVSNTIKELLVERAKHFNILLDDVSLTHLSFSPDYEKAVEAKQVAQQQAERAKYVVLKAHEERKSIIIKAEAESEAAKLIGEAIKNNPGFVELRRIETAKEVASTISKSSNRVMLNSEGLLLNLMK